MLNKLRRLWLTTQNGLIEWRIRRLKKKIGGAKDPDRQRELQIKRTDLERRSLIIRQKIMDEDQRSFDQRMREAKALGKEVENKIKRTRDENTEEIDRLVGNDK